MLKSAIEHEHRKIHRRVLFAQHYDMSDYRIFKLWADHLEQSWPTLYFELNGKYGYYAEGAD